MKLRLLLCTGMLLMTTSASLASTIQLPQTGQTVCYNNTGAVIPCAGTGQDADKLTGIPWPNPRFTDNNDGTVTDNLTGLVWLKNASCTDASGGSLNWTEAMTWSSNLRSGSCSLTDSSVAGDWRLPNRKELQSLIDHQNYVPALPTGHPFTGVLNAINNLGVDYWTSSNVSALDWQMDLAMEMYMGAGYLAADYKSNSHYIWPVRDGNTGTVQLPQTGQIGCWDTLGNPISCNDTGQDGDKKKGVAFPVPRFRNNGNGTVTDNLTGLIWLTNANCTDTSGGIAKNTALSTYAEVGSLYWQDALTWSNSLSSGACGLMDGSLAGDWRLPNIVELESIVDARYNNPAIEPGYFDNILPRESYWSSTSLPFYAQSAWIVYMAGGSVPTAGKAVQTYSHVWPVRGGHFGDSVSSALPMSKDFGTVASGGITSQAFTVSNGGTTSRMHVNAIDLIGTDAGQFLLEVGDGTGGTCGSMTPIILPGGSCTITVSFSPTAAGTKTATLRVSASDVTTPNLDIPLTGTGLINGVCGTASGGAFNAAPATELCSTGTASAVSGTGPWTWNCNGDGGGTNAGCLANIRSYNMGFTAGANGTLTGTTSQTINFGSSTTAVTAVPNANYHFVNWTGSMTSTSNPLSIDAVTTDMSLTANFAINTFAVNFAAVGNGFVSGSTTQTVDYGTNATSVTAVPTSGFHFVNWTEGGAEVAATETLNVNNVTANHDYTANFAVNTYAVNFAADANGTLSGETNQTVSYFNNAATVTAVPATGYHFVNWTEGGTAVTTSDALTAYTVSADHSYTAHFAINTYNVSFSSGLNGSVSGNLFQTVPHGADTTSVTAIPAQGFHFVNWTEGGAEAGTNPTLSLNNVTDNHRYSANFVPNPVDGACGTANGSTFPAPPTRDFCTAGTPSPLTGTGPWNWSCSGISGGSAANCSSNIQTFTVIPSAAIGSSITPSTAQTVNLGSTVTFTVTPASGYSVFVAGCGGTLNGTSYTTAAITGGCSVNVSAITRNGNGFGSAHASILDAMKTLNAYMGKEQLSAEEKIRYDVAPLGADGLPLGNGAVDIADVILILRRSAGLGTW